MSECHSTKGLSRYAKIVTRIKEHRKNIFPIPDDAVDRRKLGSHFLISNSSFRPHSNLYNYCHNNNIKLKTSKNYIIYSQKGHGLKQITLGQT